MTVPTAIVWDLVILTQMSTVGFIIWLEGCGNI